MAPNGAFVPNSAPLLFASGARAFRIARETLSSASNRLGHSVGHAVRKKLDSLNPTEAASQSVRSIGCTKSRPQPAQR
jgi:hypothetical protein